MWSLAWDSGQKQKGIVSGIRIAQYTKTILLQLTHFLRAPLCITHRAVVKALRKHSKTNLWPLVNNTLLIIVLITCRSFCFMGLLTFLSLQRDNFVGVTVSKFRIPVTVTKLSYCISRYANNCKDEIALWESEVTMLECVCPCWLLLRWQFLLGQCDYARLSST